MTPSAAHIAQVTRAPWSGEDHALVMPASSSNVRGHAWGATSRFLHGSGLLHRAGIHELRSPPRSLRFGLYSHSSAEGNRSAWNVRWAQIYRDKLVLWREARGAALQK